MPAPHYATPIYLPTIYISRRMYHNSSYTIFYGGSIPAPAGTSYSHSTISPMGATWMRQAFYVTLQGSDCQEKIQLYLLNFLDSLSTYRLMNGLEGGTDRTIHSHCHLQTLYKVCSQCCQVFMCSHIDLVDAFNQDTIPLASFGFFPDSFPLILVGNDDLSIPLFLDPNNPSIRPSLSRQIFVLLEQNNVTNLQFVQADLELASDSGPWNKIVPPSYLAPQLNL